MHLPDRVNEIYIQNYLLSRCNRKNIYAYPDFFATAGERGALVKGLPRLYPERALKNTGFLVAQQHFFDNSKSRFTANSKLAFAQTAEFAAVSLNKNCYRKNLEFALRTLFTTFSEISQIFLDTQESLSYTTRVVSTTSMRSVKTPYQGFGVTEKLKGAI